MGVNDVAQRDQDFFDALIAAEQDRQRRMAVVNEQPRLRDLPSDAIRGLLDPMLRADLGINDAMDYYLGPTGIPDRLRAVSGLLDPGVYDTGYAAADLIDPRVSDAERQRASQDVAMGLALAPMAFMRPAQGAAGDAMRSARDDVREFLRSEYDGAPAPSAPKAFGSDWQDVYHWSRSPDDFTAFDPDRSTSAMSRLGPHVGTARAAEDRYMGWDEAQRGGFTMPLRANLARPFVDTRTGQPWSEMDLEMFISQVADENSMPRSEVAPFIRQQLAAQGYTHIPYSNMVEDPGSVSNIMLTDRGGQSDAVLRSRFARFDPRRSRSQDLSAALAAGAPLGLLAMQPDEEY